MGLEGEGREEGGGRREGGEGGRREEEGVQGQVWPWLQLPVLALKLHISISLPPSLPLSLPPALSPSLPLSPPSLPPSQHLSTASLKSLCSECLELMEEGVGREEEGEEIQQYLATEINRLHKRIIQETGWLPWRILWQYIMYMFVGGV